MLFDLPVAAVDTEISYVGNGSTKIYEFPFPYLTASAVNVTLNGVTNTGYTFDNTNTIQFTSISPATTEQETDGSPKTGVTVRIFRVTATTLNASFYPGSSIRAQDLNNNFTQNLYSTQEAKATASFALDNSRVLESGAYVSSITKATEAVATADAADAIADDAADDVKRWIKDGDGTDTVGNEDDADFTQRPLKPQGVPYAVAQAEQAYLNSVFQLDSNGEPAPLPGAEANTAVGWAKFAWDYSVIADDNATDALDNSRVANGTTPETYTSAIQKATDADTTATAANNTAGNAAADAAQALSNSRNTASPPVSAITIAEDAYDNAVKQNGVTPSGGANAAITIAEAAEVAAGNAVTTADAVEDTVEKYVADANGLKGAGTTHGQTPDTDPRGVAYAVATANSAAASVAQSAIYTVVNNFAALPALTDASLSAEGASPYYQVNDSTLIQNQSAVTGEPANFIGDDELAVKLKANITASPKVWEWQEYYATDPETRYRKKLIVENLITISENYTVGIGNNAHSVGPITISHNGTNLTYNDENHAQPYVALNAATAGYTVTIPENSTWLIN